MAMASRQASKVTRSTITSSYNGCLFFFFCFFVVILARLSTPAVADQIYSLSPPSTLVVYEHQDITPPDATNVVIASPSGDRTSSEFGTVGIVSNVLREGAAGDSPVLGDVYGPYFQEKGNILFTTFTIVFNAGSFSGSISVQGVGVAPGIGELAITGGTGDFRWARGYLEISGVSEDPDNQVFKFVLTIKYD